MLLVMGQWFSCRRQATQKGSISMLIRQKGWAPILLVADLTYEAELIEPGYFAGNR